MFNIFIYLSAAGFWILLFLGLRKIIKSHRIPGGINEKVQAKEKVVLIKKNMDTGEQKTFTNFTP